MRRSGGGPASRWTVLSAAGARGALAVDAAGRIAPGRAGWSLVWEILAGERRCVPAEEASLRQRAVGGAAVALETVVRAAAGDISQTVYVALAAAGGLGGLGVLEFHNRAFEPVAVTLALRPGDFWRPGGLWQVEVDGSGAHANGVPALWWQRPPAEVRLSTDAAAPPRGLPLPGEAWAGRPQRVRGRAGRAAAELTWPVTHRTALRVLLPLGDGGTAPPAPEAVPTVAQVGRGWDLHTAGGLRVTGLPDGRIEALVAAAVRRLLALDVGPGAGGGPDGRLSPAERVLVATALAVAGFPERAAEVASVRAARHPASAGVLARREAARLTERFGSGPAVVGAMAGEAGPGGAWAGERGGDDPALRAAFLLALRDSLVTERDGCLDLLAGVGVEVAGSRSPIEAHRLVTGYGVLSFGLRWHGPRPALLWELVPPSTSLGSWAAALAGLGAGEGARRSEAEAPLLRATALAESWSSRRPAGDELLSS